jgi:hypothetical protein
VGISGRCEVLDHKHVIQAVSHFSDCSAYIAIDSANLLFLCIISFTQYLIQIYIEMFPRQKVLIILESNMSQHVIG